MSKNQNGKTLFHHGKYLLMYNTVRSLGCGVSQLTKHHQLYLPAASFVWLIFGNYSLLCCNFESYTIIIDVLYYIIQGIVFII
jgi:hypothetical protein